jgi:hypothetical protein
MRVALGLILAALLLSQLVLLLEEPPPETRIDVMAQNEKRFEGVGKFLPRSGVIGYLSDPPNSQKMTQGLYEDCYHSAAYCMAPLVVADSVEPKIILGNFFSHETMKEKVSEHRLVVLHDFNNGVFILGKGLP